MISRYGSRTSGPLPGGSGYLMPAAVQTLAPTAAQRSEALTKLSLMTVDSMFAALTQIGVSRTAGSVVAAFVGSVVVPLRSEVGGVAPARRYVASATAAWASR